MSNTNSQLRAKRIVNFIAFIGVVIVAIALVLQVILTKVGVEAKVVTALRYVGEIVAYIVAMISAFSFVKTKKSVVWAILYAVCVTAIIALLILRF